MLSCGIDPRRLFRIPQSALSYFIDLIKFYVLHSGSTANIPIKIAPVFADKYLEAGVAKGHYFHQDLWAARLIYRCQPGAHLDVASRIDGFVAHTLTFMDVTCMDIRPLESNTKGLSFLQANILDKKTIELIKLFPSVSCLHALEHFGLGRYGDPLLFDAWKIGLRNLVSLVEHGGSLYVSFPIGKACIEFNAQVIFDHLNVLRFLEDCGCRLMSFSYVDDNGLLVDDVSPYDISSSSLNYGCALLFVSRNIN